MLSCFGPSSLQRNVFVLLERERERERASESEHIILRLWSCKGFVSGQYTVAFVLMASTALLIEPNTLLNDASTAGANVPKAALTLTKKL